MDKFIEDLFGKAEKILTKSQNDMFILIKKYENTNTEINEIDCLTYHFILKNNKHPSLNDYINEYISPVIHQKYTNIVNLNELCKITKNYK